MYGKSCVIVMIGEKTAKSEWVKYEIKKAWKEKKGLFGIYIHNIKSIKDGTSRKGINPFDLIYEGNNRLSDFVECYDPNSNDAYNDISKHIEQWIERAVNSR